MCPRAQFKEDKDLIWIVTKELKCSCIGKQKDRTEGKEGDEVDGVFKRLYLKLKTAKSRVKKEQQPYQYLQENGISVFPSLKMYVVFCQKTL